MDHAKTRNTNIEFLRIMSIFSIMFLHMYLWLLWSRRWLAAW